jgi:hypothetical protein
MRVWSVLSRRLLTDGRRFFCSRGLAVVEPLAEALSFRGCLSSLAFLGCPFFRRRSLRLILFRGSCFRAFSSVSFSVGGLALFRGFVFRLARPREFRFQLGRALDNLRQHRPASPPFRRAVGRQMAGSCRRRMSSKSPLLFTLRGANRDVEIAGPLVAMLDQQPASRRRTRRGAR